MTAAIAWTVVILLFALAFAGLVIPVLPDAPLLIAGFLVFHFFIDNQVLTVPFWWTAGVMSVLVMAADYIASGLGAHKYGSSKWSLVSAALGVLIFPFFLGPVGIIVGPFVMVLLTERLLNKTWSVAFKIGLGTLAGFLGGLLVKGAVMIALVVWFVWVAVL